MLENFALIKKKINSSISSTYFITIPKVDKVVTEFGLEGHFLEQWATDSLKIVYQ